MQPGLTPKRRIGEPREDSPYQILKMGARICRSISLLKNVLLLLTVINIV